MKFASNKGPIAQIVIEVHTVNMGTRSMTNTKIMDNQKVQLLVIGCNCSKDRIWL